MAGFDPKAYGIDSRADVGLFLFLGGLVGFVEAIVNFAQSDPLTVSAMFGVAAVSAKKLLLGSDTSQTHDPGKDPPRTSA